jgi:diguanylate cyclase (GGDEF)-like protein
MSRRQRLLYDWRAWALAGSVLALGLLDMATPPDLTVQPYLVVPVLVSTLLGSPRFTVLLCLLTLAIVVATLPVHDYPANTVLRRVAVLILVGAASVLLSDKVRGVLERLRRRSTTDDLTGLLRKSEAVDRLTDSISERDAGESTGVLFVDVDGFKAVNDTYGHAAGDVVLQTMASRLESAVREGDSVARTGGDEFIVILPGIHDIRDAQTVGRTIQALGAVPVPTQVGPVNVTLSIGAAASDESVDAEELVEHADRAMYRAKRAGGNRVSTYAA